MTRSIAAALTYEVADVSCSFLEFCAPSPGLCTERITDSMHEHALYLEDLYIGQRFTSDSYRMEEERIKAFAAEFDPQPFHLDQAAAQATIFGGLAASGWQTAAVAMRLLVTGGLPLGDGIIGLGGELAWPNPTRPGDILRVESEVIEIVPSRSKPNQPVARVKSSTPNQDTQPAYFFTPNCPLSKPRTH